MQKYRLGGTGGLQKINPCCTDSQFHITIHHGYFHRRSMFLLFVPEQSTCDNLNVQHQKKRFIKITMRGWVSHRRPMFLLFVPAQSNCDNLNVQHQKKRFIKITMRWTETNTQTFPPGSPHRVRETDTQETDHTTQRMLCSMLGKLATPCVKEAHNPSLASQSFTHRKRPTPFDKQVTDYLSSTLGTVNAVGKRIKEPPSCGRKVTCLSVQRIKWRNWHTDCSSCPIVVCPFRERIQRDCVLVHVRSRMCCRASCLESRPCIL